MQTLSDRTIVTLAWAGVAMHAGVGIAIWRRGSALPLLALLNLLTALCVVAFGVQRWYGYATKGTTWYFTDQLIPIAAIGVCVLAILSLTGRYNGTIPHWIVFAVNGMTLLAAAVFFAVFRINRLF